jgi:branched-chain amino acid transport system permease protein
MTLLAQTIVGGLTAGSIYALVAIGVAMIFKVSRVLNLAQGEFVIFGALIAYTLVSAVRLPLALALLLSVGVVALLGVLFERTAIRPARSQTMTVLLVITLGVSIMLRGVASVLWGKDPMSLPSFSGDQPLSTAGLAILPQSLWIVGGLILIAAALWYFFERTVRGKAMLAAAENRSAAQMIGIDVLAMSRLGFGLSTAVGAAAGVLVAPSTFITYDGGTMIGLKGFVAATIVGMGSIPGALVGGLLLGLLEALAAGYVSSQFKDVTAFVVLILVLLVRSGLDKRETLTQGLRG